jgi:hypothetical protein
MPVSRRLRFEILRRDDHRCRYCGASAPDVELTIDHVLPVALGGSDTADNLVAACAACNAGTSSASPDSSIVADVRADALRWAAAMKEAAELQAIDWEEQDAVVETFDTAWKRWTYSDGSEVTRPADWASTVREWHSRGMDGGALARLVNDVLPRAISDDKMWRYFCGAVKNVLADRADLARSLLDHE